MAEGVLDVLAEDGEEEHVAEDVIPASVQEHRRDPTDSPGLRAVTTAVDRAGVKRRVEDRRLQVWELVEEPHREARHDDRDVDDREATRLESVGEREHGEDFAPPPIPVHRRRRPSGPPPTGAPGSVSVRTCKALRIQAKEERMADSPILICYDGSTDASR